ncbi:MAG TPA: hypothetical protein VLD63_13660 [Anaerolineales bacterium]|nr:hypothetical protein [Anaerolineales bacterium]
MMKGKVLAAAIALVAVNLACGGSLPAVDTGGTAIAISVASTLTAAAPTATAAPPTATPVPTVSPLPPRLWMSYTGGGSDAWWLSLPSASQVTLPFNIGQFYDFAPSTSRILYASHFASKGEGPANLAVSDLWMVDYPSGAPQAIVPTDTVVEALWSPDGQALGYILASPSGYELHWRTLAGEDRTLAADLAPTWSISPNGDLIAFTRETGYESVGPAGLYVVPVAGGPEVQLSSVDRHGAGSIDDRPDWSLDGTHVALSYSDPANGRLGLVIAAVDGSATSDVTFAVSVPEDIANGGMPPKVLWHPDNRHLVGLGGNYYGMGGPQDVVLFELDPSLTTITNGTAFGTSGIVVDWAVPGVSVWVFNDTNNVVALSLP